MAYAPGYLQRVDLMTMHNEADPATCCSESSSTENPPTYGTVSAPSRRRFLGGAAGLAVGAVGGLGALQAIGLPEAMAQTVLTPDQAMAELMEGNARFVSGDVTAQQRDMKIIKSKTAEKQEPIAGVLSCADSRVPVEMVFDEYIGRLFVTRVAGNIATPEIIGSLEYGVAVLGIKALLVMAHTNCGAIKAAIANDEVPGQISALFPPLRAAIFTSPKPDALSVTRQNAIVQAAKLRLSSTVIAKAVDAGTLKVVPAVYDVSTGRVELLELPDSIAAPAA